MKVDFVTCIFNKKTHNLKISAGHYYINYTENITFNYDYKCEKINKKKYKIFSNNIMDKEISDIFYFNDEDYIEYSNEDSSVIFKFNNLKIKLIQTFAPEILRENLFEIFF